MEFTFHSDIFRAQDCHQCVWNTWFAPVLCQSTGTNALVVAAIPQRSPAWHRHARARRAEARRRLRRTEKDLDLLTRHHTKPTYSRVRRVMSQWKTDQWSGSYWGSSSRRKKTNKQQAKGRGKGRSANEHAEKAADHDKELFPSYDRMQVAPSSSSFTSVDGSAEAMQKAMKSLIACNLSLNVPKEVEEALAFQEPLGKTAKDSLYTQQRMLNLRRKATNRVEKLQQALTRKGLQMNAYKEEMKQKLASELERFNKEKQEIMTALEEAKANLAKIESGAEPEMSNDDPGMEVGSDSLAQLLRTSRGGSAGSGTTPRGENVCGGDGITVAQPGANDDECSIQWTHLRLHGPGFWCWRSYGFPPIAGSWAYRRSQTEGQRETISLQQGQQAAEHRTQGRRSGNGHGFPRGRNEPDGSMIQTGWKYEDPENSRQDIVCYFTGSLGSEALQLWAGLG